MRFSGFTYQDARKTFRDEVVDKEAKKRWEAYPKLVELVSRVSRTDTGISFDAIDLLNELGEPL